MEQVNEVLLNTNNLWMMLSTALVFIMHLGFATLESGLTRAKNTTNILFKNVMIISIGIVTYAICGFNFMYPGFGEESSGILGFAGIGLGSGWEHNDSVKEAFGYASGAYTYWTDFLFQAMFAATAATIVSGAVAERVKIGSFILFSIPLVAIVYPIIGSWKWGGGWLDQLGFYDFAGSTLVHSVGGWAALAAVIILGPRKGKYEDGKIMPIPGHNMPLATIGVFLLWLGWFGFNGGSVLSAAAADTSRVLVTTSVAAAAGALAATLTIYLVAKSLDLTMALNGVLAGLVGITAGADSVTITGSAVIGIIAGIIVVFSVIMFDKLKIDDPVGAISVHLVCGIWGTLAVGIFSTSPDHSFGAQLVGVLACGVAAFAASLLLFFIVKAIMGVRVTQTEETEGLDSHEHGMEAYADFASK